jgi:two-component system, cell cycle response regulator
LDQSSQNHKAKILIVDDIPVNIQLLQNYLGTAGFQTVSAGNGEEALERVRDTKPDMILLDVMMPKMDGFEACRLLKKNEETSYIPVIMVTALNELDDKIKGIEAGADDFITKPFNRLELLARVKSLLRVKFLHDQLQEKIKQLEIAKERLRELAVTDGLTQLFNYRYFREYLDTEIRRAARHHLYVSMVMMDIDFFKHYNDLHGHPAGDQVLRTLAQLMRDNLRSIDVAVRYGGEEFTMVLPETNRTQACIVAEKIRKLVEKQRFAHEEQQPNGKMTVSMGVASFPEDAGDAEDLIKKADLRLYMAKSQGRNKVVHE